MLCVISILQPKLIDEARYEWKNDEEVWTLIHKLQQDPSAYDTFSWKMALYGTRIAYIYARTPKSNKRFFYVGAEDHRIKCTDVKDHRVKEMTDCLGHGKLVERGDKDYVSSSKKHAHIVD